MAARYLITTADEATWNSDGPVLFLGEWCKLHSRRELWGRLDSETLPYHWDDRARLYADYQYLRDFYQRVLADLAAELNRIHCADHSLRYWRILLGPWLGFFIQMLFDRWTSIKEAVERYELSGTTVLQGHEAALVPNDMTEFTALFAGDAWNHHIYAAVLQETTGVRCLLRPRPARALPESYPRPPRRITSLKLSAANWYARAARALTREHDAFLMATYLPIPDELRVQWRMRQLPQLWLSVPVTRGVVASDKRQWVVQGEYRSDFERFARALIPRQLPIVYLEGYSGLLRQTASLPWPAQPKLIWTSNSHYFDDVFKAWAAAKAEGGTPLVIGQHGGLFGIGLWCFTEEHDFAISDRYFSWGWTEETNPRVVPVGQLKNKRPLSVRHAQQQHALLVTVDLPRYSYSLYSACIAPQWLGYFEDQSAFVAHLPQRIRDALIVRMTATDYGWDQASRWRERFPQLRVDKGRGPIEELVRQSRVYISTYNATTYLEALTMQVPTLIYWNPRHWELRESAVPEFAALKAAGIFHDSPESAAAHLAAVWDDIEAWWESPPVAAARRRFVHRYSHLPDDLRERIASALHDAIAGARQMVTQ